MAVNTVTLLSLVQSLAESNSDYISVATTTNIAGSSTVVLSTSLNNYDNGLNDTFNNWWFYMNSTNNPTVSRKVSDYATSGGSLTLHGANLTAETASQTIYLFRYNRNHYKNAIIEACKQIYPELHKPIDDMTLITGNILPDGSFESWSSASALTWYTTTSNITLARTTTAGLKRNGAYSVKATASADNGYFALSSDNYPKLLDLMNRSVDFYCLVYPEVADNASIVIYTVKNNGTTIQTLTSSTSCAAGVWTILALENQVLNDDLEEIQLRFKVGTSGNYAYFDDAHLSGMYLNEYLMPDTLVGNHLSQVWVQEYGYSDPICYDINPFQGDYTGAITPFNVINDGTYEYLKLDELWSSDSRMRLIGYKPLETLSADTDVITLDSQKVPYLLAKARRILFDRESLPPSSEDVSKFEYRSAKAEREEREQRALHRMARPTIWRI